MQFFNPHGTPQEIAQAITLAINQGISPEKRFFVASYNDDTVYVQSRFGGSRFNRLNFEKFSSIHMRFLEIYYN